MMYLAGNGNRLAWKVGIANNALWWWFTISTESWGLAPLNACLLVVYIRNLRKEHNGSRRSTEEAESDERLHSD